MKITSLEGRIALLYMNLMHPEKVSNNSFLVRHILSGPLDNLQASIVSGQVIHKCLPSWFNVTDKLKSFFYFSAIKHDYGIAFTVLLTKEVHQNCLKSKKSYASHLQDRLSKLFNRHFKESVEFCFAIETDTETPHIHGAVQLAITPQNEKKLRRALQVFGGKHLKNQVNVKQAYFLENWGSYSTKKIEAAEKAIGGRAVSSTRQLKLKGQALYNDFRKMPKSYTAKNHTYMTNLPLHQQNENMH